MDGRRRTKKDFCAFKFSPSDSALISEGCKNTPTAASAAVGSDDFLINCLNAAVLIKGSRKEKTMKKTTLQRACVGLVFVAALLIKIPLANAQQKAFVFPEVADGVWDNGGYYKSTFIILPTESSTAVVTCGFVLYGLGVDLDGKGLVTGWTATVSPGIPYVASSSADQPIHAGYATLSCTDYVRALVFYTSYTTGGPGTNLGAVFGSSDSSCSATNGAYMDVNQQGGSQLAFAIANNTTQTGTYEVRFFENNPPAPPSLLQGTTVTVPAHTSYAKFLTEILPASSNRVGYVQISPADLGVFGTGFSVIALRFTGAAFTTIPVSCYFC
jgi:hypothetical protein